MKLLVLLFVFIALATNSLALKNEICGLPHSQVGYLGLACRALIPSWSYNFNQKECVDFNYGGCWGNANRFHSKESCEEKCLE
ncbi:male accessory gland serine protease inhibitor [Drosophila erecta]|uniref:BPTI/Kunitz inhibitor domain-containing protein n=1 Tax=Drosophila erecta TaxID=7220 RepID=A0A0Q5WI89_DROER|nr:male accessory gland serine protease inhibitor [Drosophila erecta]KQS70057.1 uncharacterized protein Dere_GG26918 [Drosophila erecta]